MSTPEAKVKARIRRLLKKHHAWYCMPSTHGFGRSGVPDFICAHHGCFIAIEAKTRGNKPTKLQQAEIDAILKTGSWAIVVDEDALESLDGLLAEISKSAKGRAEHYRNAMKRIEEAQAEQQPVALIETEGSA